MKSWLYYGKGYLLIRLFSMEPERFLNMCAHHRIPVWNLKYKDGYYEMNVSIRGFYQMKPVCKKTKSRVKIIHKYGLPFFFHRNKKRKAFFTGIILAFCMLLFFSAHIWNIHVEGNYHNSTEMILDYLDEIQIYHGILKSRVDCSYIAEQLRREFPDITWVSARISGTKLILEIKENKTANKTISDTDEEACNITAEKDGVIVSMITRNGIPQKKVGDTCSKGDILVLGRLDIKNDSQETVKYEYTAADADIYIETKMDYYYEFPLQFEKAVYTGESKKGYVLRAGDYYLQLKGTPKWDQYETVTDFHQVRITENFRIPIYYGTSMDYASKMKAYRYSKKGAEMKAKEKINLLLETLSEKGVQISENHVKIEINSTACVSSGYLKAVERAVKKTPVELLEQPTERNLDIDE